MAHHLTTGQVLKLCGGIARGTLYRWMNPKIAAEMRIETFPSGTHKDGKSRLWDRIEVEGWVGRNSAKLHRHPHLRPDAHYETDRSHSVELTLGQAFEAAKRVAEDDQTGFNDVTFEEEFIIPMTKALLAALRSRGASGAVWMEDKFTFIFPAGDEGDSNAVAFKLAFT